MADSVISVDKVKAFWHSQVHDEERWNLNKATISDGKSFGIGVNLTVNKVKRRRRIEDCSTVGKSVAKIDICLGYKGLEARKVARDDFSVGEIFISEGKKHPYNQCVLGYQWKEKFCIKLLRATALFAGSIIFMRQYGDLMAI
ncbi:hypothetical protein H5410_018276 [Solanum commersonii]|uniref:Uncharacterized protein n=1 Tax=Solanum commersonii TaxID=4109 RepID=A0A9J6A2N9_SOLCO|nr:hypothetical protein H5410_018276 [Solanum commersonii]